MSKFKLTKQWFFKNRLILVDHSVYNKVKNPQNELTDGTRANHWWIVHGPGSRIDDGHSSIELFLSNWLNGQLDWTLKKGKVKW